MKNVRPDIPCVGFSLLRPPYRFPLCVWRNMTCILRDSMAAATDDVYDVPAASPREALHSLTLCPPTPLSLLPLATKGRPRTRPSKTLQTPHVNGRSHPRPTKSKEEKGGGSRGWVGRFRSGEGESSSHASRDNLKSGASLCSWPA